MLTFLPLNKRGVKIPWQQRPQSSGIKQTSKVSDKIEQHFFFKARNPICQGLYQVAFIMGKAFGNLQTGGVRLCSAAPLALWGLQPVTR